MIQKSITQQINELALELIAKNPDGMRWVDLNKEIAQLHPEFHPKTINGTVWKLTEKFPNKVYKPEKGLFKIKK